MVSFSFRYLFNEVNKKKLEYQKISENFSEEITKTLHAFSFRLNEVVRALKTEEKADLYDQNFARRFFNSHLELLELDEIQLFTSDCKLISGFSLVGKKSSECKRIKNESLFISTYRETPFLTLGKNFDFGGSSYRLQGSLHLSKTWLKQRPLLGDTFKKEGLTLATKEKANNTFERKFFSFFLEKESSNKENISLLIDRYYYPILSSFPSAQKNSSLLGEAFILLLCLLLLLMIYFDGKKRAKETKNFFDSFEEWCHEGQILKEKELYSLCLKELREENKNIFSRIYKAQAALISNNLQEHFKLQTKFKEIEKKLEVHQKENMSLSFKSDIFSQFNAFTHQVQHMFPKLKISLEELDERARTLDKSIKGSILKKLDLMSFQFHDWKIQGESVGFRKHMRTLYETKGSYGEQSMLEEQVLFFSKATSSLIKELESSSVSLKEISEQKNLLNLILSYWHDFSCTSDKGEKVPVVLLLEKARNIHKVCCGKLTCDLDKVSSNLTLSSKINPFRFIASLDSLFHFCEKASGQSEAQLAVSSASEDGKDFLLISYSGNVPGEVKDQNYRLSEELLKPMGVLQSQLNVNGASFLSLEWQSELSYVNEASSKGVCGELGL